MTEPDFADAWEALYSRQFRPWRGSADLSWTGITPGSKVLDAGCGNGKCTGSLIDMGCDTTGADFSGSAVEQCRARFPNVSFDVADLRDLPYPNGSFDAVLAVHSIEHIPKETEHLALSEFRRILKPSGRLCLQVFAAGDFRSGGKEEDVRNGILYRYHTEGSIREALSGWTVERMETVSETTRFGEVRRRIRCVATVNPYI